MKNQEFRACHFNATSLCKYIDYARMNFQDKKPFHVIAVTETRFHSKFTDKMASIANYNIVRNDRIGRTGGGVALYVHNSLKYKVLTSSSNHGNLGLTEYLLCEVEPHGHHKLFVAVIYRPPNSPFYKKTDFLEKLSNFFPEYNNKLILGDFNSNMLTENPQSSIMRDFINQNGLKLIDHGVTYITENSSSHIDLCIVDEDNIVIDYGKSYGPFILNHFLISVSLQIFTPGPFHKTITFRRINNINKSDFCNFLLSFDWDTYFHLLDVNDILLILETRINLSLDKFAPLINFTPRNRLEPWITSELRQEKINCNRLYKKYNRHRVAERLKSYRDSKHLLNENLLNAKISFYKNRLTSNSDPQKLWTELKNLGLTESSESPEPIFTLDTLNNYYSSVQCLDDDEATHLLDNFPKVTPFIFSEITESDIFLAVKHFTSKSVGIDKISIQIIQLCLPILAPMLLHLFNQSLNSVTFPYKCKKSLILPLKKNSKP